MNLNLAALNVSSQQFVPLLKDRIFPSLSPLHKKILFIAALAFGLLALCYSILHHEIKTRIQKDDGEKFFFKAIEDILKSGEKTLSREEILDENCKDDQPDAHPHKTSLSASVEPEKEMHDPWEGEEAVFIPHETAKAETHSDTKLEDHKKKTTPKKLSKKEKNVEEKKPPKEEKPSKVEMKPIEEGTFVDGLLQGPGKITHPDGTLFEGEFHKGKLNQGRIVRSDKTIAEGTFKDDKLEGQGKIIHPDGTTEEGTFKDGKLEGQGKIKGSDGKVIAEGKFIKGEKTRPNGFIEKGIFLGDKLIQGTITLPYIGLSYEGLFKNGKLHGLGKIVCNPKTAIKVDSKLSSKQDKIKEEILSGPGNWIFDERGALIEGKFQLGAFVEGKIGRHRPSFIDFNWEGKFKDKGNFNFKLVEGKKQPWFSREIEEGTFNDDAFLVQGKITDPVAGTIVEGTFNEGSLHGEGKKTHKNGDFEEGTFKNGVLHGKGKSLHEGTSKEGTFKEGALTQGKMTCPDFDGKLSIYEGKFDFKTQRLLSGKKTEADGTVEEGNFKYGKLEGKGKRISSSGKIEAGQFKAGELLTK